MFLKKLRERLVFMTAKIKVLMDCDPGHDDAFALIVASKFADVLGVTTVAGNAPLSLTTKNARIILDLCGSSAPLHSGASRPLVAEPNSNTIANS